MKITRDLVRRRNERFKEIINPTSQKGADFKTFVVTFSKRKYNKRDWEYLSDIQKIAMASVDNEYIHIYTPKQYTDMINSHKPMDVYVHTEIITLSSAECTQLSTDIINLGLKPANFNYEVDH